jgi:hypothetical protein
MTRTIDKVDGWLAQVDRVLRRSTGRESQAASARRLSLILTAAGLIYGAVMGTFGGVGPSRVGQIIYSAAKVPLLLLATFGLSLPNFFVLSSLLGLRQDFRQAIRALAAAQSVLTIILASLAPFTALWYASFTDYSDAVLFNAAMFAIASGGAQIVLRRLYAPLIAGNRKHVWALRLWLTIYSFVGIQIGWVLRPYVGDPNLPTRFLRTNALSNAYVFVAKMIWEKLR